MKKNASFYSGRRGLSLTEIQISMAIAIVTLLAAVSLYIFYWRTFVIGNNMLDVYSNSRVAIGLMARDIRAASQIVEKYPESGTAQYQTSDSVIVLKVPSLDAAGNLLPSPKYDYIIYKLLGTDLYQIIVPYSTGLMRQATNRIVARYCSSLSFSAISNSTTHGLSYYVNNGSDPLSAVDYVSVYLPLNKSTISLSGSGVQTSSIAPTTMVRLRNK